MLRTPPSSRRKSTSERPESPLSLQSSALGATLTKNEAASHEMVEMGYLHLQVKDLQNTSETKMDLQEKTIIISVDYLTDKYCKVKTLVAKGDKTKPDCWGSGLFFRVFAANKEVTLEVKATASNSGGGDTPIDFGSSRFSLVPSMDTFEDSLWCVMQDRFGRRNNCRIQVGWRYVTKLNRVKPSIMSKASSRDPEALSYSHHLVFSGFASNNIEPCEALDTMIERVCCGRFSFDEGHLSSLLLLNRCFSTFRDTVYSQKLSRWLETPSRYWEAPQTMIQTTKEETKPILDLAVPVVKKTLKLLSPSRHEASISSEKLSAILAVQRVYRGHIIRKLFRFAVGKKQSPKRHSLGKPHTSPRVSFARVDSFKRPSFSDDTSDSQKKLPAQVQTKKKLRLSKSFMLKSQILIKALTEIIDTSNPSHFFRSEFESMQWPSQSQSGFCFRPSPHLIVDDFDAIFMLARKAVFMFLSEQIQKGVGILRSLEPAHDGLTPQDVEQLMEIGALHVYDHGQTIFEQNVESDSFGIVCAGNIRVLYNRREVSTLIRGQSFGDLGMVSAVNAASIFGPPKCVHGASFVAAERSYVLVFLYSKFLEHVKVLGHRVEAALKNFLNLSDSIGRETWSAYGNSAKSIEISFLYFMSTRSGLLGLLNMVEVRALASIATYQKFNAHEFLCKQGERAGGIFIILTGIAAVIVDGKQVAFTSRGQEVGEMGLIGNFARLRSATLVAHYDCEVALITYENFMSFIEILSQHQAQRLASYVASTVLPKYLTNLNLRRDSEAEFAANKKLRASEKRRPADASRNRRMSIAVVNIDPSQTMISDFSETFAVRTESPAKESKVENTAHREAKKFQSRVKKVLYNNGVKNNSDSAHGFDRLPKDLHHDITIPYSPPTSKVSGLHETARRNIQNRDKEHTQTYLIPMNQQHEFLDSPPLSRTPTLVAGLRASPLAKRVCSKGSNRPSATNDSNNAGIERIKCILRSCFENIAEVMVVFDESRRGSLTVSELIEGFKKIFIEQKWIILSLSGMKGFLHEGMISALDFMRCFCWSAIKTDEDLLKLWVLSKKCTDTIIAKFEKIKLEMSVKDSILQNSSQVIDALRRNASDVRQIFQRHESRQHQSSEICVSTQVFRKELLKLSLGLGYSEIDIACRLVMGKCPGEVLLSDVEQVLRFPSTPSPSSSCDGKIISAVDHPRFMVSEVAHRPNSARCYPPIRVATAQRPHTGRPPMKSERKRINTFPVTPDSSNHVIPTREDFALKGMTKGMTRADEKPAHKVNGMVGSSNEDTHTYQDSAIALNLSDLEVSKLSHTRDVLEC